MNRQRLGEEFSLKNCLRQTVGRAISLRGLLLTSLSCCALASNFVYAADLVISSAQNTSPLVLSSGIQSITGNILVATEAGSTGTLSLLGGSISSLSTASGADNATLQIGTASGATGIVTVSSTASQLSLSAEFESSIIVGDNGGTGTLRLANGGQMSSLSSFRTVSQSPTLDTPVLEIGKSSGSTGLVEVLSGSSLYLDASTTQSSSLSNAIDIGTVGTGTLTVSGSGSTVRVEGLSAFVNVGLNGTGTMDVLNGGSLRLFGDSGFQDSYELSIARDANGVGTVSVGENSSIYIGNDGPASVGPNVLSRLRIGADEGAEGLLLINGNRAQIEMSGQAKLAVAEAGGTGEVKIENGLLRVGLFGSAYDNRINIGDGVGSEGKATVTGANSALEINGPGIVNVGLNGGYGQLILSDGGTLSGRASPFSTSFQTGLALEIGDANGGIGQVTVQSGAAIDLINTIGGGTASLTVGGTTGSTLGVSTLNVENNGSSVIISATKSSLNIGAPGQTGFVQVSDGGLMMIGQEISTATTADFTGTSASVTLGASGTSASGSTSIGLLTLNAADLVIGAVSGDEGASDALSDNVYNATALQGSSGVSISQTALTIGQAAESSSVLSANNGSRLILYGVDSKIAVGENGTGSLLLADGAQLLADSAFLGSESLHSQIMTVAENSGSTGVLAVNGSNSLLSIGDALYIGAGADGLGAGGNAIVTVSDSGKIKAGSLIQIGGDNANTSTSRILLIGNTGVLEAPSVVVGKGGLLAGTGTINGNVLVRGGSLFGGIYTTSVSGVHGTTAIQGDLALTEGGKLNVLVSGGSAGQYDVFSVSGAANLSAGGINLTFLNGYTPSQNDSFTFLLASGGITLPNGATSTTYMSTGETVSYRLAQGSDSNTAQIVITNMGESTAQAQEETITETTQTEAATVTRAVVTAISNRVRAYQRSPTGQINQPDLQGLGFGTMTGVAGGDSFGGLNFWTDGTVTRLNSDNLASPFDGYTETILFGADKLLGDGQVVIGFAGGLDNTNLSLKGLGGERDSFGGSGTVYAGYLLNETFSLDGQIGFGRYNNDIANHQAGGGSVSGSYKSNRMQASLNLSANKQIDQWSLYASGGYSWLQDRAKSYEASDGNAVTPGNTVLGQFRMTGEAAYQLTETIQPYATATYEIDSVSTGSGDPNGMVVGFGVRAPVAENITFGASATGQVLRDKEDAYALNINLRFSF